MQIMRKPQLDKDFRPDTATPRGFSWSKEIQGLHQENSLQLFSQGQEFAMDQLLIASTRAVCETYKIHFAHLSTIQRKFVTHYRCSQCGLLPLYNLDLLHIKRVRCRKCGQLIAFKRKGKYGKLRKEIAFELMKEIRGGVKLAEQ